MSDFVAAIILGIVEGLTEFLPVSSTGHLILMAHALQLSGERIETFEVFIQLGAILAVVVLYFDRFLGLLQLGNTFSSRSFAGFSGLAKLGLACLPAFVLGALFHSTIKQKLFSPLPVAGALILGGVILILIERRKREPTTTTLEALSFRQCFLIGVFQCAALWPGVSRSASTIVGAILLGADRKIAAEFSFLVAVPVMVAAVSYDLWKSREFLSASDAEMFAVGFIVSFLSAAAAVKLFIGLLQRFTLAPFGYYRIALGIAVLAFSAWTVG